MQQNKISGTLTISKEQRSKSKKQKAKSKKQRAKAKSKEQKAMINSGHLKGTKSGEES
jgi:F0F1-type ATP synthase membrane subunit b/b'